MAEGHGCEAEELAVIIRWLTPADRESGLDEPCLLMDQELRDQIGRIRAVQAAWR